jgi:hypothetical protein
MGTTGTLGHTMSRAGTFMHPCYHLSVPSLKPRIGSCSLERHFWWGDGCVNVLTWFMTKPKTTSQLCTVSCNKPLWSTGGETLLCRPAFALLHSIESPAGALAAQLLQGKDRVDRGDGFHWSFGDSNADLQMSLSSNAL